MNNEELKENLNKFIELLYEKENVDYRFYYQSMFRVWELRHSDTRRADRPRIYNYLDKYFKGTAKFSMWESTHSKVEFKDCFEEQLLKAIKQLEKTKDPYVTLTVGKTYKLNQDLHLSTRVKAKSGSIIKMSGHTPKSWGGYYLTIVPIEGKYALTVHSCFFNTSTKDVNGSDSVYYTPNELMEIIGVPEFTNQIDFNNYAGAGRVLATVVSNHK